VGKTQKVADDDGWVDDTVEDNQTRRVYHYIPPTVDPSRPKVFGPDTPVSRALQHAHAAQFNEFRTLYSGAALIEYAIYDSEKATAEERLSYIESVVQNIFHARLDYLTLFAKKGGKVAAFVEEHTVLPLSDELRSAKSIAVMEKYESAERQALLKSVRDGNPTPGNRGKKNDGTNSNNGNNRSFNSNGNWHLGGGKGKGKGLHLGGDKGKGGKGAANAE
jgi:hypothetical protein